MLEITTYKNYKELCKAMNWEEKAGNSRVSQLKELESLCSYHKEGNKFVIDEVFENPIPIKDGRVGNFKNYPQFKVNKDKWYNKGVYMIKLDNQVYIGSTVNFRGRFIEHKGKRSMEHTKELLKQGAEFFILHDMTDIEDEELLRMVEYEYIKYFRDSGKFTVLNDKDPISFDKYYRKKQKYVNFKVREDDWEEVALLLKERGIKIC